MTTIIYMPKEGIIAADRMFSDNTFAAETDKIRRLKDGGWFAGCGECESIEKAFKWWEEGRPDPAPALENISVFVVYPDRAYLIEAPHTVINIRRTKKPIGIGTGAQYALGALDAGVDVATAIRIAVRRDKDSGGRPQVVRL